jgi:hypothetical protein
MKRALVPTIVFASLALAGCHSKHKITTTDDGGSPNDMAMSSGTCGKLPPTGASQVVPPTGSDTEVGIDVQVALDRKGRPVLAYLSYPGSGEETLYVMTWDDCLGVWRTPITVDTNIDHGGGSTVSLSIDPSDGRVGIGYQKRVHIVSPPLNNDTQAAYFALSTDDAMTFTATRIDKHKTETDGTSEGDADDSSEVAAVLSGGNSYVAWVQNDTACPASGTGCAEAAVFATSTGGAAFTRQLMQDSSDTDHGGNFSAREFTLGLAVDSAGKPGLVAHQEPPTMYNTTLAYWRPGDTAFTTITDSDNMQNDDGAATLVYDGLEPRVVSRLQQGPLGGVSSYDLVFSSSTDGATWLTSALPRPEAIGASQQVLAKSGTVTVVAGGPHVFRSTDLTTFSVTDESLAQTSTSVGGVLDATGKLWMVVEGVTPAADSTGGIVLYREP